MRVVTDELPYHYRWRNKTKALFRGTKPGFIPNGKIVSKKEMRHYQYVQDYKNPIEKAREFKRIMQEEGLNQTQLSIKLSVSYARIHQILNLLNLDKRIVQYLTQTNNHRKNNYWTERKLRKLTQMSKDNQYYEFVKMRTRKN